VTRHHSKGGGPIVGQYNHGEGGGMNRNALPQARVRQIIQIIQKKYG
jgi:hypothetical protein